MSLLRPLHSSRQGVDNFQQLVEDVFGRSAGFPSMADERFNMPATDISENENEYCISAELPVMKKDDINVSLHDGVLSIEAVSKSEHEEKGDKQIRTERRYGKFVRRFTLGDAVDESSVQAKFEDGVLKVVVEKAKQPQSVTPKSIPIS